MNYQAYFLTAQYNNITFDSAFQMLTSLMNITADLEEQQLREKVQNCKYELNVFEFSEARHVFEIAVPDYDYKSSEDVL